MRTAVRPKAIATLPPTTNQIALMVLALCPACSRGGASTDDARPLAVAGSGARDAGDVDAVCVGDAHGCALTREGRIACWGDNQFHQVSPDGDTQLDSPRWVGELAPATAVRCGPSVTCTLSRPGEVACIGFRYHESTRLFRVQGAPAHRVKVALSRPALDFMLAANGGCAILDDHSVSCWSDEDPLSPFVVPSVNDAGSLAVASARARAVCLTRARAEPVCLRFAGPDSPAPVRGFPVRVTPLAALAGASELLIAGDASDLVCARDGRAQPAGVVCANFEGRLVSDPLTTTHPTAFLAGNGTVSCMREGARVRCGPVGASQAAALGKAVPGEATALAISPGHACAVVRGRVSCWGEATRGQIGDGTRYQHGPSAVPGIADATGVVAGHGIACAARKSGKITCWGRASFYLTFDAAGFADIATPTPVTDLAIGKLGTPCGRIANRPSCWDGSRWVGRARLEGRPERGFAPAGSVLSPDGACAVDRKGRLGCAACPSCAPRLAGASWVPGPFVEVVSLGGAGDEGRIACARGKDGHLACFGMAGEDPDLSPVARPDLEALDDVVRLVASSDDVGATAVPERPPLACALTRAGVAICWSKEPPAKIEGLPAATDIAVGGAFACATTRDGQVYCWGSNREGGAPDGAPRARATPVPITWPTP
ncbi:MAG TPA: RCC1 domain-containing protein [Polyangia bacterium]|nr:RCC1 domain-containing protein [Polyangia bacterium]